MTAQAERDRASPRALWLSRASFRPEGPWEEAGPEGAGGKPRSHQALPPRASGYRPWMKVPISWDHRGHK